MEFRCYCSVFLSIKLTSCYKAVTSVHLPVQGVTGESGCKKNSGPVTREDSLHSLLWSQMRKAFQVLCRFFDECFMLAFKLEMYEQNETIFKIRIEKCYNWIALCCSNKMNKCNDFNKIIFQKLLLWIFLVTKFYPCIAYLAFL